MSDKRLCTGAAAWLCVVFSKAPLPLLLSLRACLLSAALRSLAASPPSPSCWLTRAKTPAEPVSFSTCHSASRWASRSLNAFSTCLLHEQLLL